MGVRVGPEDGDERRPAGPGNVMGKAKDWTIEALTASAASSAGDLALRALDARRSERTNVMIDLDVIEWVAWLLFLIIPHLQKTSPSQDHDAG